jgi:hypothetical protein
MNKKLFDMQTIIKKYISSALLLAMLIMAGTSTLITSCEKDDKSDDKIALYSFGPMPIARGAELKFIGKNLDKITSIMLPGNQEITTFTSKTSEMVTLTVPQDATPGLITVKTPQGDIATKTPIGYSEPISIESFLPATVKAGDEITIKGDYLNLVKEVIFTDRVTVAAFVSQSRKELKVKVPKEAQTGKIIVSNGAEEPILVYSTTALAVKLPAFTKLSPNPVKAGTALTVDGTDLDLVTSILLGGNKKITTFTSQTATQIVLNVPADTKDGKVTLIPASGVNVISSDELVMVVPTVSVSPTTVKNGGEITVTGTNLDLVDQVVFGGNKNGVIKADGTATQIVVTVPNDAVSGVVKFVTKATKEVAGPALTIVDPVFTDFTPKSAKAKTNITITGTNLDLVVDVKFEGGLSGTIVSNNGTQLVVSIPVGAQNGKVTLVTKNNLTVLSTADLTMLANLPEITGFVESRGEPGKKITIQGTKLDLIKELVFPGNVYATAYGLKSATSVEVYVPMNVTRGVGQIKILTYEGEEGISPSFFFGASEPIKDLDLIINDFDEAGHDLGWDNWGAFLVRENNAAYSLSGYYARGVKTNFNGWSWVWGCNHAELPKKSVTKAGHYLKIDINITKPIKAIGFTMKIGGTEISLGNFGLSNGDGTTSTPGWITMTWDLSTFNNLPEVIPASGDWGLSCWTGETIDLTGLMMDNFRFERK